MAAASRIITLSGTPFRTFDSIAFVRGLLLGDGSQVWVAAVVTEVRPSRLAQIERGE